MIYTFYIKCIFYETCGTLKRLENQSHKSKQDTGVLFVICSSFSQIYDPVPQNQVAPH